MPSMIYNTRTAQKTGDILAPEVISYTRMLIITACKSSCGKVMFSQACVKNSVDRGGMCGRGDMCGWEADMHGRAGMCGGGRGVCSRRDDHCS